MSSSSTARSSCPCSTTPVLWPSLPPPLPWSTASACGWSPRVSRLALPTPSWPGWAATRRRATTCPDPCPPPSLTTGCAAGAPSTSSPVDWTSQAPSWTGGSGCCPAHETPSAPGWSGRWDCSPLPTLPLGFARRGWVLAGHGWSSTVVDGWLSELTLLAPTVVCWLALSRVGLGGPQVLLPAAAMTLYIAGSTSFGFVGGAGSVPLPFVAQHGVLSFYPLEPAASSSRAKRKPG